MCYWLCEKLPVAGLSEVLSNKVMFHLLLALLHHFSQLSSTSLTIMAVKFAVKTTMMVMNYIRVRRSGVGYCK